MPPLPRDLLLVAPTPHAALARLGDSARDVTVSATAVDLSGHDAVLLSGAVDATTVAELAAALDERPVTLGIDLVTPPSTAALAPLTSFFQDTFVEWGEQPVALVASSGVRHVDPALIVGLAPLLSHREALPSLAEAALAQADGDRQRLEDQLAELRQELGSERRRGSTVAAERDAAASRARELEGHPALRLSRLLGRLVRRLPGRGVTAAVLAGLAVAIAVALAVAVATGGRTWLGVAVALIALGVVLNVGLVAALAVVTLRSSGRAAGAAHQVDQLVREHRRTARDVRAVRRDLTRHRSVTRDRHLNTSLRLRNLNQAIARQQRRRGADLRTHLDQVQAAMRLFTAFPVTASVPPMGGWAASADLIGALVDEFLERRPAVVVECGSGVSTLWLAVAARQFDVPTRIIALDHDAHYAAQTRALVARHGLSDLVEVRHAPLRMVDVGGHDQLWYDPSSIEDLDGIGLLFVDGPPAATGEHARFPALPLLEDKLAEQCSIMLDDMLRPDDQEVAQLWQDRLPALSRTDVRLEKGATIFRRG